MVSSRHRDNHWIAMDGQPHTDVPRLFLAPSWMGRWSPAAGLLATVVW